MVQLANYLVSATGGWSSVLLLMAVSSVGAGGAGAYAEKDEVVWSGLMILGCV